MTRTTQERLLTAVAVGEMLSPSKRTIHRLNRSGKIPALVGIGGSVQWFKNKL
jgi:predicted DNA-binding transcriptional regulator AlpA